MKYRERKNSNYNIHTDAELFRQATLGDSHAFSVLYDRYWEPLLITATRVLRSSEDACDIVQDVFTSLWRRRETIVIEGSVAAYLHTSVRYHCIHQIERNITHRDYLPRFAEILSSTTNSNADEVLQFKEFRHAIEEAVNLLPPKMQQAYRLSREQELTHRQIAQIMNISTETVKKHIQYALISIRRHLLFCILSAIPLLRTAVTQYLSDYSCGLNLQLQ